ncbi:hypothetical protein CANTEDRAFT_105926 [Yamadazyma tenuis ATCC 10573]|uniref:GIY-YIG domain-containing protein n=1 Tax=Candida tenuis (strain ATCC 10573 / BCRC 21748 / CBS 615 / JCM 9827 / NBRC 10315 / NRRL Y-1498 / VKM Y-70) TaxID=590646 RepID=G3B5I7_CANTC|nr:uncharacterized protein CANTEDRAFT_105926 [Yamadazyma tenuis ATCC 10573]EGV63238.1 hypothetical protein CANTEDRAFT_105926 [Yamadazyma tenuis ATCC 10573]
MSQDERHLSQLSQSNKTVHVIPFYTVYLLQSGPRLQSFYIGSTPNPCRRLRQHNGELQSGAYRTRKDGFRPWHFAAIITGFSSKISALQFEHALQHPHSTRHIPDNKRVSRSKSGGRSVHLKLANIRLLVSSRYFGHLGLCVNIFSFHILDVWNANKHSIEYENMRFWDKGYDEFVGELEVGDFHMVKDACENLQNKLMQITHCTGCGGSIDMMPEHEQNSLPLPAITLCVCQNVYHLRCLSDEILPKYVHCKICGGKSDWFRLAMVATQARSAFL